jgi:hypothetical protein
MNACLRQLHIAVLLAALAALLHPLPLNAQQQFAIGERMYREGLLPSGELISGIYAGDVPITGEQVICGFCHRRSGLGSSEGQEVIPAVTGDILFKPLRLPTSKPPLAPEQRPAYTDETLKRAIREGIGADGEPLSTLMPRYALSDDDADTLVAYLRSLNTEPGPGVTDEEIHFATVVSDAVDPHKRKAYLDVFERFFEQKNVETRNESQRADHAPWHKAWVFEPYRKWVLHVWELEGDPTSWPEQLEKNNEAQPVFALIGGLTAEPWQTIHDFCESSEIPCLFPDTDIPALKEADFYTVYMNQGMALEAGVVARHLADDGLLSNQIVQVYQAGDPRGQAAAFHFRRWMQGYKGSVTDLAVTDGAVLTGEFWRSLAEESSGGTIAVLWLGESDEVQLWRAEVGAGFRRVYLSSSLRGVASDLVPPSEWERVYLVHSHEVPKRLRRLLTRSTGWLKAKRIYAPDAQREQANAFFALKMAGSALKRMRGFFVRDYLLENIEHMVDNASFTSIYPRVSLAPGQRFVSRGAYIAQFKADGSGGLVAVTDWLVPASSATPDSSKTDVQPRQ